MFPQEQLYRGTLVTFHVSTRVTTQAKLEPQLIFILAEHEKMEVCEECSEAIFHSSPMLVSSDCHAQHHRLSGLHNRNLIPHGSGGWKCRIKVPAELVPSEGQERRMGSRPFPVVYRWLSSSWVFTSSSLCVLISSSCKDTDQIGLGPTHMISL